MLSTLYIKSTTSIAARLPTIDQRRQKSKFEKGSNISFWQRFLKTFHALCHICTFKCVCKRAHTSVKLFVSLYGCMVSICAPRADVHRKNISSECDPYSHCQHQHQRLATPSIYYRCSSHPFPAASLVFSLFLVNADVCAGVLKCDIYKLVKEWSQNALLQ